MRFALLGEQATGKSSLLVALYGALVNRRAGDMRIVRTVDDVEFLSRGLEAFGRRESVPRTDGDSHARLMIEVAYEGHTVDIELPDRSGELLRHMIDGRTWDPELRRQIKDAAGAMLFLRCDHLAVDARRERERSRGIYDGVLDVPDGPDVGYPDEQPAAQSENRSGPPREDAADWTPGLMPTDVRAIDLLQAVVEDRPTALPLAIIVSAWDLADSLASTPPASWLAEHVPLLDQFLASHSQHLPHAVFGVSAQGLAFDDEWSAAVAAEDPWDRAFVIGPDGWRDTLAAPIAWLINAAA